MVGTGMWTFSAVASGALLGPLGSGIVYAMAGSSGSMGGMGVSGSIGHASIGARAGSGSIGGNGAIGSKGIGVNIDIGLGISMAHGSTTRGARGAGVGAVAGAGTVTGACARGVCCASTSETLHESAAMVHMIFMTLVSMMFNRLSTGARPRSGSAARLRALRGRP